jgi:two-component system OmpR family response regulator
MLARSLRREGYAVDAVGTGADAVWGITETDYDIVVLDAMIPGPDGFEVLREVRGRGRWVPVLMLTARDRMHDKVRGLDAGADDYLTKPFALDELLARVRALLRRDVKERPTELRVADLALDPATRTVRRGDSAVPLSAKEFALLHELMRRAGETLTRTYLIEHVWDFAYDGGSNVVDVYVRYLRDKVDRPFARETIQTVRGVGYRLDPDA